MTDKTIFAHTDPAAGANHQVPYVNLRETGGKVILTVRSAGVPMYRKHCGTHTPPSAHKEMSRIELADLAQAILAHLGAGADLRAKLDARLRELFHDTAVTDVIAGDDFPLGKACDLSGEGTCEACQ